MNTLPTSRFLSNSRAVLLSALGAAAMLAAPLAHAQTKVVNTVDYSIPRQVVQGNMPFANSYNLTITSPAYFPAGTISQISLNTLVQTAPTGVATAQSLSFVTYTPLQAGQLDGTVANITAANQVTSSSPVLTFTGPNQGICVTVSCNFPAGNWAGSFGYEIQTSGWPVTTNPSSQMATPVIDQGAFINVTAVLPNAPALVSPNAPAVAPSVPAVTPSVMAVATSAPAVLSSVTAVALLPTSNLPVANISDVVNQTVCTWTAVGQALMTPYSFADDDQDGSAPTASSGSFSFNGSSFLNNNQDDSESSSANAFNQYSSIAGNFGLQVVYLRLNINRNDSRFGKLKIHGTGTGFDGGTISQAQAVFESILGGARNNTGQSIATLTTLIAELDCSFNDGVESNWAGSHLK